MLHTIASGIRNSSGKRILNKSIEIPNPFLMVEKEKQWIPTQSWILHAELTTSKRLISFYFGNNSMTWIIRMFDFDGAFVASTDKMMHLTALFCMWYRGWHKFHYILPLSFTCHSRCHQYYRQIYGYVVAQTTMYCRSLSKIHFHQMSLQRNVK